MQHAASVTTVTTAEAEAAGEREHAPVQLRVGETRRVGRQPGDGFERLQHARELTAAEPAGAIEDCGA